ncbi:MAG TPA: DUF2252 family protein [Bryobacteraceae bacterium]|nr:DUF2252 family protein [Bryobacteraceae bacterium]
MKIGKATRSYEAWLAKHIRLLEPDLERKHAAMAADVFPFLRATFYRWMQLWPEVCPEEQRVPKVLAVGDLHVENFGTWRDVEGRLVWGINDFDEAFELPYSVDLVRLAASAHIAIREARLQIAPKDACDAILGGYKKGLQIGGRPFVLAEDHPWLREMVTSILRDPEQYWEKLASLPTWRGRVPKSARRALERMLPEPGLEYRVVHRIAGLGSLGRERFVALAEYRGGMVAREAKALAPSACLWAGKGDLSERLRYQETLDQSRRAPDPFVRLKGRWIVRRLAPDCSRIELSHMPTQRDETKLLQAMGFEIANVHLGTPRAIPAILQNLRVRTRNWMHQAATGMVKATTDDWRVWRAHKSKQVASRG